MEETKLSDSITAIEQLSFEWDFEYSQEFGKLIEANEKTLTKEQRELLSYEIQAFRFMTQDTTIQKGSKRLRPSVEYTDGSKYPDPDKITEAQVEYYYQRLLVCTNPRLKLRYLDIVWEKTTKHSKKEIGESIVETCLILLKTKVAEKDFSRAKILNRAMQVAILLKSDDNLKQVTDYTTELVSQILDEGSYRLGLEVVGTVILNSECFSKAVLIDCIKICEQGIKHYKEENDNFTLRGAFVECLNKLKKMTNPQSYDAKTAAKDVSQTFIDEADKRSDSKIVQQHFLVEAEKILKDAGLSDDAREIRKRVEAIGKSEGFEDEFKSVSIEQKIPQEVIDSVEKLLRNNEDTCALIAISPSFMPSWIKSEEVVTDNKDGYTSLTDIIANTTIVDENGMTIAVDNADSNRKATMRHFEMDIGLKTMFMASLIEKLIKEKVITIKNFELQFAKIKFIDKECWESVQYGLKLFIKEDYYPASLILTTQLENFIFCILPLFEVEQYIFENNGRTQSPKTLRKMLADIKDGLETDIYELFNYVVIEKGRVQIRDKVAHGKTGKNSNNLLICIQIIQLFSCILIHVDVAQKDK